MSKKKKKKKAAQKSRRPEDNATVAKLLIVQTILNLINSLIQFINKLTD